MAYRYDDYGGVYVDDGIPETLVGAPDFTVDVVGTLPVDAAAAIECNPNILYPEGTPCALMQRDLNMLQLAGAVSNGMIQTMIGATGTGTPAGGIVPAPAASRPVTQQTASVIPANLGAQLSGAVSTAAQFVQRNAPAVIITLAILMLATSVGGGPFPDPSTVRRRR